MKTGVEKHIVWSEIGSGLFGGPGGTLAPKKPQKYPVGVIQLF